MNNERQITPQGTPERTPGQQNPGNSPVQDGYDQQPMDRDDRQGRTGEPGAPNPDPTYEPRRPEVTGNAPGSGVFNGMHMDRAENDTQAGVEQNLENEALYGQDDYALYSRKLDEFDERLTQDGTDPSDPESFRQQSASLRARLEDAQRQGQDQWNRAKQGLQDSFVDLDRSWNERQGRRTGQEGGGQSPDSAPF